MIDQGSLDGFKVRSRFDKALGTVAQIDDQERVWTTRRDLHESILQLFDAYQTENELDAICIRDIVRGTDLGPSDPEDGRHAHLLRLDLSEQPHLRTHFEALKRLRDLLEAIARFGMSYADTIPATPLPPAQPATLDLFADCIVESASTSVPQSAQEPGSNGIPANRDLAFWAEKIGLGCEWATESDEAELRVTVEFKHPRPAADKRTDYRFNLDAAGEVVARADAVAFLREALWCAHGIAAAAFKPNVSSRPMPAVFDVLLPVNRPSPVNADIQSLTLDRKACGGARRTPNAGKVALAHLTVPVSELNLNDYAFTEEATRDLVEKDFFKAVRAAKASDCLALVFPEYSIPEKLRGGLLEIASSNGMTIIGGFEGSWRDSKLADEVFIAIPGEPSLYHQFKHSPSLEEQSPANIFHDGSLRLFTNSPIGDFAVVVCSDFLETATLDAWSLAGPLPDILFVVARNNYPDLYEHFAVTDSFRLYCSVVVCNVRDDPKPAASDGTFVVSPRKDKAVDWGENVAVDGTYLKKITVHDIPFSSLRARERGKPVSPFFAVPRSAKRA